MRKLDCEGRESEEFKVSENVEVCRYRWVMIEGRERREKREGMEGREEKKSDEGVIEKREKRSRKGGGEEGIN